GGTCLAITDAHTNERISKAVAKNTSKINSGCAGLGQLPPIGPACDDSATTSAALGTCITASRQDANVELLNADTLIATIYDTTAPVTDTGLLECQAAIGREVRNYAFARYRSLQKCNDSVAKGKIVGPCPDAAAVAKIESKRATL